MSRISLLARRERKKWVETKTLLKEKCGLSIPDPGDYGAFFVVNGGERRDYRILCRFREMVEVDTLQQLIQDVSGVAGFGAVDVRVGDATALSPAELRPWRAGSRSKSGASS